MPARSKKPQFWSVQKTGRVDGQAAGRGRALEKANRDGVRALFSLLYSNLRAGPK